MSYEGLSQDVDTLVSIYGIACNVLIANYVEHEHAKEALKWFWHIYVSWNALVVGYAEHGPFSEILKCIQQIKLEEIVPNVVTYSWCLKACGRVGDVEKVRRFYAKIVWDGLESDICIDNSVIGMYARCWSLLDAQDVFDILAIRNILSWNALITRYVEHDPTKIFCDLLDEAQEALI